MFRKFMFEMSLYSEVLKVCSTMPKGGVVMYTEIARVLGSRANRVLVLL